jgi:hypothetical protein
MCDGFTWPWLVLAFAAGAICALFFIIAAGRR